MTTCLTNFHEWRRHARANILTTVSMNYRNLSKTPRSHIVPFGTTIVALFCFVLLMNPVSGFTSLDLSLINDAFYHHLMPTNGLRPLIQLYPLRSREEALSCTTSSQLYGAGTSNQDSGLDLDQHLGTLTVKVVELTRRKQFEKAYDALKQVTSYVQNEAQKFQTSVACGRATDDAFMVFTHTLLAAHPRHEQSSIRHILLAVEAINLQLSLSGCVMDPFDKVPRLTFVKALQALTTWNEVDSSASLSRQQKIANMHSTISFRILQRLITGVGVRNLKGNERVFEKDINMVLNTFSNSGQMDVCQRIVSLQLRSERAPPISPTGYSILVKGYGKLGDLKRVSGVLRHATKNPSIQPDIVFMNSLIAAYVNCNAMDKAQEVFDQMRRTRDDAADPTQNNDWFREMPRPNKRTYNTILKGYAQTHDLKKALELFESMKTLSMWDAVSVNTLVQVALVSHDYDVARNLLDQYTSPCDMVAHGHGNYRHPNTEAYTHLLDCLAKSGRLSDSLAVFQLMRQRGITQNEVTFTCLVSGLARHGKFDEAHQMLSHMSTIVPPTVVTYNSFIAAVLHNTTSHSSNKTEALRSLSLSNDGMEEALKIFGCMIKNGIKPDPISVSTIIDAMGRCSEPRVGEAVRLVSDLRTQNVEAAYDVRVLTSLLRTCGLGNDINGALMAFKKISKPDVIAVNALLDACCRCDRGSIAMKIFGHFFGNQTSSEYQVENGRLKPDLISYSTLIGHHINSEVSQSRETAVKLYSSMKETSEINPDIGLVDSILRRLLTFARSGRLSESEISLIVSVIRDAESLDWSEGFLERRKRAVRVVLSDCLKQMRYGDAYVSKVLSEIDNDDDLFRRKGWNQMDSTFRLLGANTGDMLSSTSNKDEFLKSKGWNSVDSGFRIL